MSYLGLDIGTGGCKAVVFNGDGRPLASAYREYPLSSPNRGWAELDSEAVLHACEEVIGETSAQCKADPVAAMCVSCQGEAFTPVAADRRILSNAMVSSDARAASLVGPWSERFGVDRLYAYGGHTPHPMFTLYKLLWLREHRPDVWNAAAKFYCFEDLFQSRLGFEPAISHPLAGRTMLFDVRNRRWHPEILEAVGLEASRLARPAPSGETVGTIAPAAARRLGLADGVLVVAGGHDQPCGALGAGIVEPGRAMYATGTVECICPAFDRPIFSESLRRNNLCTYEYTLPDMYTTVAFSLTGGNLLRWFRDEWAHRETDAARRDGGDPYEHILRGMAVEPTELLVLPFFTPSGTPYFDAGVPGAILGLRLTTSRGEVLRALLEGVALEMRLNVDLLDESGLAVREFRAIGGGAKSLALTQLKADVLHRPITTLAVTEAGCLGAAALACAAHTNARPQEIAPAWSRPTGVVEPDAARARRYDEKFAAYRELYPKLREVAVV